MVMMISRSNIRTMEKMSFIYFVIIIWYLQSYYAVDGHERAMYFSEQNCSINSMRQIPIDKPDIIIISNCSLKTLPNAIFLTYATCISLSICNTNLVSIEDFALDGLERLETLSINRNHLTRMTSWSEYDLVNLRRLDLHHNQIQTLSLKALQHYPNLQSINLSINNLRYIPENIFKYTPQLRHINLAKNRLRRIDGFTFKELKELTHISLEHNDIDFVNSFAFVNNVRLKSLRLDFNRIVLFDTLVLFNCQQVTYVNLSYNALTTIHGHTFKRNSQLNMFDISGNKIMEFANNSFNELYNLKPFVNLKLFDASSNKLTYLLDGVLDYLSTVEYINLSNNAIDGIETNVFTEMIAIQTIDLANNKLSNDSFLDGIKSDLKTLIMSHNQFEYLNLSKLVDVDEVDVIGNPWNCTWLVAEMIRYTNGGVRFGRNFSISTEEQVLTVPGIDCVDDSGNDRSIVMLQRLNMKIVEETVNETPSSVHEEQNKLLKRMLENEFGYKACLIWTAVAVIVVFGAVHFGQIVLKKSEKRSERYRLPQQVSLITTATTPTTANSDSKIICH